MDLNINSERKKTSNTPKIQPSELSNIDIPKKQLDDLKRHKLGLKVSHNNRRQRFIKKLDSSKKLFSFVITPTTLMLSYTQNVLKFFIKNPIVSSAAIVTGQNIVYAITDGIELTKRTFSIPSTLKAKFRMQQIKRTFLKNFNKDYSYDWLKFDATNHALNTEREKIKAQINSIKIFKIRLKLKEQTPEIENQLRQLNNLLTRKKNELYHINEYIAIVNLENINKQRLHQKLTTIAYSSIGLFARSTIIVLGALYGTNPIISLASSTVLFNNFFNYYLTIRTNITQLFRDIAHQYIKKDTSKNLINSIMQIPSNSIDEDIVLKSRLGRKPLLQRDFNNLLILKNKTISTPYLELEEYLHKALSAIGREQLTLKQVETIKTFLNSIEQNIDAISPENVLFINDLRNSINDYFKLFSSYDIETIQYNNDLYTAKKVLTRACLKNMNTLSSNKSWLAKVLNGQYYSNQDTFNMNVFDYFSNSKLVSPEFKNNLINSAEVSYCNHSIWRAFNPDKSTISQNEYNEDTAEFIINLVSSLPAKKRLMKDNVDITINDLNLENESDRILLNDVYQNWTQYEHAKYFLKACLVGNDILCSAKLMNQIRAMSNETDRRIVKTAILKELSN